MLFVKHDNNNDFSHTVIIFQISFEISDCMQYYRSSHVLKEIKEALIDNIKRLCSCYDQFNTSLLLDSRLVCFDESPQTMVFQAQLSGTILKSASKLLSFIKQWIISNGSLTVQGSQVFLNTNCALVIPSFDSEKCPESEDSLMVTVIISGAAGGGAFLVTLVIAITCILVVTIKRKKFNTKE